MDAPHPPPSAVLPRRIPWRRSAFLATAFGWALPGLGQLYAGQPRKALLFLAAILPTFLVGWWLTDFTAVQPAAQPLPFAAQVFLGGPTLLAWRLAEGHLIQDLPTFLEVGRLYTWVAGLLNLVAVCDAVGDVIEHNRFVDRLRDAQRRTRPAPPSALPASPPRPPAATARARLGPEVLEGRERHEESR
jgi:hypothetical protein